MTYKQQMVRQRIKHLVEQGGLVEPDPPWYQNQRLQCVAIAAITAVVVYLL